jgi:hypothetical protein
MTLLCLLVLIQPTLGIVNYVLTYVYPDTPEQCAECLVPISSAISYQSSCINVVSGSEVATTSYSIQCYNDTTYALYNFVASTCMGSYNVTYVPFNSMCTYTNNPAPNIVTIGSLNMIQSCKTGAPDIVDAGLPTLIVAEYATPTCNINGLPDPLTFVSNTTASLNVCQNTGGSPNVPQSGSSFVIQCNSTTAYISYYTGYGCLPTKLNTISPLFPLGCSTNTTSATSVVVSCSSGSSPNPSPPSPPSQPSNDVWTMIIQSPYLIYGASAGAGLIGGGLVVCLCICLCRRRNRKNRNKRPISTPTPFSTSILSDEDFSDGIGTPLRSDVLPGVGVQMSSPSKGGQLNNQGLRTPLLSQTNEDGGDFNSDDS